MFQLRKKETSSILLFHRVSPFRDPMWDPMDTGLFERILVYAKKNYDIIPLNEIIFNEIKKGSKPKAAITFDDGYKDFCEYAFPILKKHQMPSSLFIVTDSIDKNVPTWTYLTDHFFYFTKKLELVKTNEFYTLPKRFLSSSWKSFEDRISYGKDLKQFLKLVPTDTRNKIIENVVEQFDDVTIPDNLMLSWSDLRNLSSEGVEIGAHSVHHPTMSTLNTDEEILFELKHSGDRIKQELGAVSTTFSYPCGSYNQRVKSLTRQTGYKAALAVKGKSWNKKKEPDLFEIPRIELYNERFYKTQMRLSGTINTIKRFLGK